MGNYLSRGAEELYLYDIHAIFDIVISGRSYSAVSPAIKISQKSPGTIELCENIHH